MRSAQYATSTPAQLLASLGSSLSGLKEKEVQKRLGKYGKNQLEETRLRAFDVLLRQLRSPFVYLLLCASVLTILLGEVVDGAVILLFVVINTALGFYQEYQSEKSLEILKRFIIKRARVIREGKEEVIDSNLLVPGDIVVLETGDRIPADVRIVSEEGLRVNESVLTGESVDVAKRAIAMKTAPRAPVDAQNIAFCATIVTGGRALGVVIATGSTTELGDITRLTVATQHVSSFEKGIGRFSTFILRLIVITLVFVFLANLFIKGNKVDVVELLVFSIALAVSVIPEALPTVATFCLTRGALRLAQKKVVVKRLSSIEDLGSIEVLCTDKTGTLTQNILTVDSHFGLQKEETLLNAGFAFSEVTKKREPNNAFDLAIWNSAAADIRKKIEGTKRLFEVPFEPVKRKNSVVVEVNGKKTLVVRGAVDEVVGLCPGVDRKAVGDWVRMEGEKGKRIIAVASKEYRSALSFESIEKERGLRLVGLISFTDPLKKSTIVALEKAKSLHVQVKILTGDSPEVAGAVAKELGLVLSPREVVTGDEFARSSHEEKETLVWERHVFARVTPQEKYEIVSIIESKHEVGFLGEGINDAPALKIANVGLVVDSASDIARDAADVVLLSKSLSVIVDGIEEGRKVFANTSKYIRATLSSNFGNFYAVAFASLIIDFLPMLPIQILMLNLLSDFPMIAIATDSIDPEELITPRSHDIREIAMMTTLLGIVSTLFDFIFFALFYRISPEVLQTNWFIASIVTELLFLFSVRTKLPFFRAQAPSRSVLLLTLGAFAVTLILPFTYVGIHTFQFTPPTLTHLSIILSVAGCYLLVTESVKLLYYRVFRRLA